MNKENGVTEENIKDKIILDLYFKLFCYEEYMRENSNKFLHTQVINSKEDLDLCKCGNHLEMLATYVIENEPWRDKRDMYMVSHIVDENFKGERLYRTHCRSCDFKSIIDHYKLKKKMQKEMRGMIQ